MTLLEAAIKVYFNGRINMQSKIVISTMRVAIYARVSTNDNVQDPENQLYQLRDFAEKHGSIYKVYTEEVSGGKADQAHFKLLLLEVSEEVRLGCVLAPRLLQPGKHPSHAPLLEEAE
jgi:predicted site-specific integrase-resolvase